MDGPGPRLISLSFEGMQPIACFGGGRPRIYLIRTPVKDYHASRSVLGTPMLPPRLVGTAVVPFRITVLSH